jgi:hypothetical protein
MNEYPSMDPDVEMQMQLNNYRLFGFLQAKNICKVGPMAEVHSILSHEHLIIVKESTVKW